MLTFLVLVQTSGVLFHYFNCARFELPREAGGGFAAFLYRDYSVDCRGGRYRAFTVYAAVMIAIYPVGSKT